MVNQNYDLNALRQLPKRNDTYKALFEFLSKRERPRYIVTYKAASEGLHTMGIDNFNLKDFRDFCNDLESVGVGKYSDKTNEVGLFWKYNFKDVSFAALETPNPEFPNDNMSDPTIRAMESDKIAKVFGKASKPVVKKAVSARTQRSIDTTISRAEPTRNFSSPSMQRSTQVGPDTLLVKHGNTEIQVDLKSTSHEGMQKVASFLKSLGE